MAYETRFALRQFAITNTGFTDVVGAAVLPINCTRVVIYNNSGQTILLRTDPANAASEVAILDGQQFEMGQFCIYLQSNTDPICSLKSTTNPVNVIVESLL